LFEYQHLSLTLETSGCQRSNLYLDVVHFFYTSVNYTVLRQLSSCIGV